MGFLPGKSCAAPRARQRGEVETALEEGPRFPRIFPSFEYVRPGGKLAQTGPGCASLRAVEGSPFGVEYDVSA